jgi:hypothetical protein
LLPQAKQVLLALLPPETPDGGLRTAGLISAPIHGGQTVGRLLWERLYAAIQRAGVSIAIAA